MIRRLSESHLTKMIKIGGKQIAFSYKKAKKKDGIKKHLYFKKKRAAGLFFGEVTRTRRPAERISSIII